MNPNPVMLSDLTLEAVRAESIRAHLKHGEKSMLSHTTTEQERLAALVEEVGEVAQLLTYDKKLAAGDQWKDLLVKELIQVANVAASWAQVQDGQSKKMLCAQCGNADIVYWMSQGSQGKVSEWLARRNTQSTDLMWCSDSCYNEWLAGRSDEAAL